MRTAAAAVSSSYCIRPQPIEAGLVLMRTSACLEIVGPGRSSGEQWEASEKMASRSTLTDRDQGCIGISEGIMSGLGIVVQQDTACGTLV